MSKRASSPRDSLKHAYRFALRHRLLAAPNGVVGVARHALGLPGYVRDWRNYSGMDGAEPLALLDSYPVVTERTQTTAVEPHYFHVGCWASRRIAASGTGRHVDVGSDHRMLGVLSAFVSVVFVDIRPLSMGIDGLQPVSGDALLLPLRSESVASLSCLHAAEHIGLGRYGDALNPFGTRQAARELTRVLQPGGNLYLALPVGRPRVEFNAHRVHAPSQILHYFGDLELTGFAAEDDAQCYHAVADPDDFERADYACGMFWFRKPIAAHTD
jgi:hypothetical protein